LLADFLPLDFLAVDRLDEVFFAVDFLAVDRLDVDFFAGDLLAAEVPLLDFLAARFDADFFAEGLFDGAFFADDFFAEEPREPPLLDRLDDRLRRELDWSLELLRLPEPWLASEPCSSSEPWLSSELPSSSLLTTSLSRISPRQPSCSSCSSMVCIVISRRN
jgi:hypothetical protein